MKITVSIILLFIASSAMAAPSREVQIFLEAENVDIKKFEELDESSTKILTETILSDGKYLQTVISSTDQLNNKASIDPELLVAASQVRASLEQDFTTNRIHEFLKILDRSLAVDAKFPMVNASGTLSNNVFAVQYAAYREFPEGSNKYYGYGLYMTIDASSIAANTDVSLPYLAASATIQNKSYSREAYLVGIEGAKGNELLNVAFPGDQFDITNFSGYAKFKEMLKAGLADKSITLSPVLIEPAAIKQIMNRDGVTLVRTNALISLAKGLSLENALNAYTSRDYDTDALIKNVYLTHANITALPSRPSSAQKSAARSKLTEAGVTF